MAGTGADFPARLPRPYAEIRRNRLEFVEFLASEPAALAAGPWPPFMVELAHYEWVEMVLQQSEAEPLRGGDVDGLLDYQLQVSALAWPLAYTWSVQVVGPHYQPDAPPDQPTMLLVRRTGFQCEVF